MRQGIRYGRLAVLAFLLAFAFLAAAWLLGTTAGARWIMAKVSAASAVRIEAGSVAGSICRGLHLRDLSLSWPEGSAKAGEFTVQWQPAAIFAGRVSIRELSAKDLRVSDNRPEVKPSPPVELSWPRMAGFLSSLTVNIAKADVQGLTYQRQGKPPVGIERIFAEISLSRGTLELRKVLFAMPQLRIEGRADVGLASPLLRTDMKVIPATPVGGMDRIDLRMKLTGGRGERVAEGGMSVAGLARGSRQVGMESRVALFRRAVRLSGLQAVQSGRKGSIGGSVEIDLANEPSLHAALELKGLDLSKEAPPLAHVNGSLRIDGSPGKYRGTMSLANKGPSWQEVSVNADFDGTAAGIKVRSLNARWLGGAVTGSAEASWKEVVSASASLKARELKPSLVNAEWTGVVNMDVAGAFKLAPKGKPEARVSLLLERSILLGRSLQGELRARLLRDDIALDRLQLDGKGFTLQAAGRVKKGIGFSAKASDLALFAPDVKGSMAARGTVRKNGNAVSGTVSARAAHLAAYGMKAASLRLALRVEQDEEQTLQADLSGEDLSYNAFHAGALSVSASGTQKDHELRAEVRSKKHMLQVRLAGGYTDGTWQGSITHLSGSEPESRWKAERRADITISPKLVSISRLVITSTKEESLEVEARLDRERLSGTGSLDWKDIDISRANAWLAGISLSGATSGSVHAKLEGQNPAMTGTVSLSHAVLRRRVQDVELKAEISSSEMSVSWQGQAVEMKLALKLAGYGAIDGSLQLPLPARLPLALAEEGQLRGAFKGRLRESGTLSFLFPGLVQESRGQADLDLAVSGTWKTPVVRGSLLLDKAGGYFPAAGIRLTDLHMEAQIERSAVRITALKARSGSGWVQGKAVISLEAWSVTAFEGSIQGEKFQALFLPQMRLLVSPAIRFSGTPEKVTVRGEVKVPELLIYGPPREAAVKPSEDVVIVGQREKAAKGGQVGMDVEVKITLGERVIVKAEGADAQLKGDTVVVMHSLDSVVARGEITVAKGKYSAYGVGLDITRGRILFAGGPVDNPSLDILAVKTVKNENEVKAGVQVTGTVQKPVVKLYSQPAMTDADILSYMVLGHALGAQDKEQSSALMKAAGALLSAGQSTALQDQVKHRLGLDVIDIESGGGNVSRSLVTVGKYLSPRLYVSYGRALFSGENLFKLRYKFGKRLELESHSGETSGVDLYYTVQFD